MALIKCAECGREVSDKASTCIGCGAPLKLAPAAAAPSYMPPPQPQGMGPGAKLAIVAGGLVVMFVAFGIKAGNSPEAKAKSHARGVIDLCWSDYERKSLDAGTKQFVAGVCENKETEFIQKYGHRP